MAEQIAVNTQEFDRPSWGERKFNFVHPPWMLADFTERLRGTVPRIQALVVGLTDAAHAAPDYSGRLLFMSGFRCPCGSLTALNSMPSTTTIIFFAFESCAPNDQA